VRRPIKILAGAAFASAIAIGPATVASAADSTHRVSQSQMRDGSLTYSADDANWYRDDTRVGGGVTLTKDFGAPSGLGDGALALTTNSTNNAKAQLLTSDGVYGTLLGDVTSLSYWTYQSLAAGGSAEGDASYQLRVDIDGDTNTTGDITNLVFEPYWNDSESDGNPNPQPIAPDTWQFWDATNLRWWSSKQITCGEFSVAPGAGGPPFTTPSEVGTNCPNAIVLAVGANVGSYNPNYISGVDGIHFGTSTDSITWDFGPK
jgi:hypothetical protein